MFNNTSAYENPPLIMTYETVERYEAAYLLSQGFKLKSTALLPSQKLVAFTFEEDIKDLDSALIDFENDGRLQKFIQGFEQVNKLIRREQDKRSVEHGRGV